VISVWWWWSDPAGQAVADAIVTAAAQRDGGLPAWFQIVSAVLGAGGMLTALGAVFLMPANRRKVNADTATQLSDAALKMAENADARAAKLDEKVAAADKRVEVAEDAAEEANRKAWAAEQRAERAERDVANLRRDFTALREAIASCPGGLPCPRRGVVTDD
jgi:hypothetical protein